MKTNIKHLAAFAATAIWADGEYDEAEKVALSEIAEAFEIDEQELAQEVDAALNEIENMDEEQIGAYIIEHSAEVEDEEAELIYEAVMQIVIIDGVLGADEVETLLSVAAALGIDDNVAVLLLADLIKEEPELEIEF